MSSKLGLFLVASALVLGGCGTVDQIHTHDEGPAAFGGVRYWVQAISSDHEWRQVERMGTDYGQSGYAIFPSGPVDGGIVYSAGFLTPIFDFPLSFALDVAILPFSVINEVVLGGIEVHGPSEAPQARPGRTYFPDPGEDPEAKKKEREQAKKANVITNKPQTEEAEPAE